MQEKSNSLSRRGLSSNGGLILGTDLARCLAGPALECVGEGANLLVPQKPCDLRNRPFFILQIPPS